MFGETCSQFSKFSHHFPSMCFSSNREKITSRFVNLLEKYGVSRVEGWWEVNPPRNRKISCRRMMLFAKFRFLATKFPRKSIKRQFFKWFFITNFQNFLKISHKFQNRMVLKFFGKKGENTAFFAIVIKSFLQIFQKFSGVRGAPPPDPLRGRTCYLDPPNFVPACATG